MFGFFKDIGNKAKAKYRLSKIEEELFKLNDLYSKFIDLKSSMKDDEEADTILKTQGAIIRENYYQLMRLVETYGIADEFREQFKNTYYLTPTFEEGGHLFMGQYDISFRDYNDTPANIKILYKLVNLSCLSAIKRSNMLKEISNKLSDEIESIKYSSSKIYSFDIDSVKQHLFEYLETSKYQLPEEEIDLFFFLLNLKKKEARNQKIFGDKKYVMVPSSKYIDFIKKFNFQEYDFYYIREERK